MIEPTSYTSDSSNLSANTSGFESVSNQSSSQAEQTTSTSAANDITAATPPQTSRVPNEGDQPTLRVPFYRPSRLRALAATALGAAGGAITGLFVFKHLWNTLSNTMKNVHVNLNGEGSASADEVNLQADATVNDFNGQAHLDNVDMTAQGDANFVGEGEVIIDELVFGNGCFNVGLGLGVGADTSLNVNGDLTANINAAGGADVSLTGEGSLEATGSADITGLELDFAGTAVADIGPAPAPLIATAAAVTGVVVGAFAFVGERLIASAQRNGDLRSQVSRMEANQNAQGAQLDRIEALLTTNTRDFPARPRAYAMDQ